MKKSGVLLPHSRCITGIYSLLKSKSEPSRHTVTDLQILLCEEKTV